MRDPVEGANPFDTKSVNVARAVALHISGSGLILAPTADRVREATSLVSF